MVVPWNFRIFHDHPSMTGAAPSARRAALSVGQSWPPRISAARCSPQRRSRRRAEQRWDNMMTWVMILRWFLGYSKGHFGSFWDICLRLFKLFLWFQLWPYRLIFSKGPKSNLELLDQWFWSTFNSFLLTPTGTDSCIYLLPGMHQGCQKPQVDTWTTTEHQRREKSTANTLS